MGQRSCRYFSRAGGSFGLKYDKKADFYETLGVSPRSSESDLKKAYYKLAQKFHPDKSDGNKAYEEKFKAINAAYEVLKDPDQRQVYDQLREADRNPNYQGNRGGAASADYQSGYGGGGGNQRTTRSSSSKSGNYYEGQQTKEDFYKKYSGYEQGKKRTEDFFKDHWKDFWDGPG